VMEVRRAGSPEQLTQARAVLAQTRRSMYRILAEDDPTGTSADAAAAADATTATTVTDTPPADDAPESRA
jgi:hypothetical protein